MWLQTPSQDREPCLCFGRGSKNGNICLKFVDVHLPLCIQTLPSHILPMETSTRSAVLPSFLKFFSSFPHLKTHLAAELRILSSVDSINIVPSSFIFVSLFLQDILPQRVISLSSSPTSVFLNAFSSNKNSCHPIFILALTFLFLQTYELWGENTLLFYFNFLRIF